MATQLARRQLPQLRDQVLPEVTRRGMAALSMKSLGGSGEMVRHGTITGHEGLRYAMSFRSQQR